MEGTCSTSCTFDGLNGWHRKLCRYVAYIPFYRASCKRSSVRYCWRNRALGSSLCTEIGKAHVLQSNGGMTSTPYDDFSPPGLNTPPLGFYNSTAKQMKEAGLMAAACDDEEDDELSRELHLDEPGAFASRTMRQDRPRGKASTGGAGAATSERHSIDDSGISVMDVEEVESLRREGKFLISKITEEIKSSKTRSVVVYWLGFNESSTLEFSLLPIELQNAWDARPHKWAGPRDQYDTTLYVCEPPPGNYGRSSNRRFNIYDRSEREPEEMRSVYGTEDKSKCDTEKDKAEDGLLHTGGMMYAVSNCGIILMARELYRCVKF